MLATVRDGIWPTRGCEHQHSSVPWSTVITVETGIWMRMASHLNTRLRRSGDFSRTDARKKTNGRPIYEQDCK